MINTKTHKVIKPVSAILVEGLPGIGNVGKIAIDYLVDEFNAKKIASFTSDSFPNSVFVNEDGLIDLPEIQIYYAKIKTKELLFLTGDIQPKDERGSYEFCEEVIKYLKKLNCTELITTGGIGLQKLPKNPKVYITGNNKALVKKIKASSKVNDKIYGVVGPIIGVTGLLLGVAQKQKIAAAALLAETYAHPLFIGMKSAQEILKILNDYLDLKVDIDKFEKEVKEIEDDLIKKAKELTQLEEPKQKDYSYIG
jgi:uncharacterized protein